MCSMMLGVTMLQCVVHGPQYPSHPIPASPFPLPARQVACWDGSFVGSHPVVASLQALFAALEQQESEDAAEAVQQAQQGGASPAKPSFAAAAAAAAEGSGGKPTGRQRAPVDPAPLREALAQVPEYTFKQGASGLGGERAGLAGSRSDAAVTRRDCVTRLGFRPAQHLICHVCCAPASPLPYPLPAGEMHDPAEVLLCIYEKVGDGVGPGRRRAG